MQAKIQAIKDKVAACVALAESTFGIKMPTIDVRFDLTGRAAGMAGYNFQHTTPLHKGYYLRFNIHHMQLGGQSWDHLLNDTVPHEVAHTVCQSHPQYGRQHNPGWKRVCRALGGNGERCYRQEDAPEAVAHAKPYAYTTSTGHIIAVSANIHNKIQRGSVRIAQGKGRISKDSPYTRTQAHMLASAAKPAAKPAAQFVAPKPSVFTVQPVYKAPTTGGTNADKVRALISAAKSNGWSEELVIASAVFTLGMTRTLARTYVKNNWNKV